MNTSATLGEKPRTASVAHDGFYPQESAVVNRTLPLTTHAMAIFRRRKWAMLGVLVFALLLGLLVTLFMTPQYAASVTIEIRRESENLVQFQANEAQASAIDQEFYQTQYGLLKAHSLAERVATKLNLGNSAAFFETFKDRGASKWFDNGVVVPRGSSPQQRKMAAAGLLLDHIDVGTQQLSRLVTISFTSPDPALSKQIINTWGEEFIQQTLARRFDTTSYARTFLEGRLVQLRNRIDQSERALVNYAARNSIVTLPATEGKDASAGQTERSLVTENLTLLNRDLAAATVDRVSAQSRLTSNSANTTESLTNDAINVLRPRRAELAADYARLMTQFSPQYPPAKAIAGQIAQLDRSISREEARVQGSLTDAYHAASAREAALRANVNALKGNLFDQRRRSVQYNIILRDADTNRQLYDALLQRYKQIGVAGGVGVNNISIVDDAELPAVPSSPKLALNMAFALVFGLAASVGLALLLEQADQGITDPSEVERELGFTLLGVTPRTDDDPINLLNDQKSVMTEAYLSLQTTLQFATSHGLPKTLAITSTRPSEGKTTTSYALAKLLTLSNQRVLIIDCDMRSPSLHGMFEVSNKDGLSNYLVGRGKIADLVQPTRISALSVMTAGPPPPNAAELLVGGRMEQLLAEATELFDRVIIDMPPVLGLADAPLLGSMVESTIFVVEARGIDSRVARVALQRLRATNTHIVGIVLTKFDSTQTGYGYTYSYAYGKADER